MILKKTHEPDGQSIRAACIKPFGEILAPLTEGPTPERFEDIQVKKQGSVKHWIKGHIYSEKAPASQSSCKRTDLRLLLSVLGAPLAPVAGRERMPQNLPGDCSLQEKSPENYILQQYLAATGVTKLQKPIQNSYAMGRVKMIASEFETVTKVVRTRNPSKATESGCFVLWQMLPEMWNLELVVAGSKICAGSNGKLVWRYTPWLGNHSTNGPIRSLRRSLQGLDPRLIASTFATARCDGEKKVGEEDCFVLKLTADSQTLAARSDGPTEVIRHVLFGYFSQRTGLLVRIEDSHLTRIQETGRDAVYWETTIESNLEDYRIVEGLNIAHAGVSTATLFSFGEVAMSHTKTRMEEVWLIEEFAYNVPGLSADNFIPPADIIKGPRSEDSFQFLLLEKIKVNNRSQIGAADQSSPRVASLLLTSSEDQD